MRFCIVGICVQPLRPFATLFNPLAILKNRLQDGLQKLSDKPADKKSAAPSMADLHVFYTGEIMRYNLLIFLHQSKMHANS